MNKVTVFGQITNISDLQISKGNKLTIEFDMLALSSGAKNKKKQLLRGFFAHNSLAKFIHSNLNDKDEILIDGLLTPNYPREKFSVGVMGYHIEVPRLNRINVVNKNINDVEMASEGNSDMEEVINNEEHEREEQSMMNSKVEDINSNLIEEENELATAGVEESNPKEYTTDETESLTDVYEVFYDDDDEGTVDEDDSFLDDSFLGDGWLGTVEPDEKLADSFINEDTITDE